MARKVLLADDSVTAQNMGRKILTDAGYDVVTVNNGSAALKKIAESRPDVIVLDVYMPGYSGLEVCQRVKENKETAGLPVLLTVGKLEPFKHDEARRVRADAFIIKPFEASELLAALGKLEDKLVAPEPVRTAKHASTTMASFERLAEESGPKYGDQDSGWKDRLKIPAEGPRITEHEPAAKIPESVTAPVATTPPVLESAPHSEIVSSQTEHAHHAWPSDITSEEIAALSAAMTRITSGSTSEIPAADKRTEQDTSSAVALSETKEEKQEAHPGIDAASVSPGKVELLAPTTSPVAAPPATPIEIERVIAAIAPSNGNSGASQSSEAPSREPEHEPAQAAEPTVQSSPRRGSRWIAEEVSLAAQESGLILEQEMRRASERDAARNAAIYTPYTSAPVDRDDEPAFATMAPPAIGTPVPCSDTSNVGPEQSRDDHQESPVDPDSRNLLPLEVSKPPAPPFAAAEHADDDSIHGFAAIGGPQTFIATSEGSDVAAATSEDATRPGDDANESEARREAEMAAATAAALSSWKEIRESVIGTGSTAQPEGGIEELHSERVAQEEVERSLERKASPVEEKALAAAAATDASSAQPPAESDTIASIVDSMLAELRPKLVAEIAKKLEKK